MTPERWLEVREALEGVLALAIAERDAELARMGESDPALRAEVESLLRADEARPEFLAEPYLAIPDAALGKPDAWLGRELGVYRLVAHIGEGGMGTVYRAVRTDGLYARSVAVKLIRSGLSTDFFLRRFANEREILARLDHPNVARLLDGGVTEERVPYVVMEFVDGEPIDGYCRKHRLSIADRLRLFCSVCSAVQYAHQNLIVHRDLKPGNVLVREDGEPKLLDFGIAKILDTQTAFEGNKSRTMLPMMTPEFASPEQLRGEPVTTASDTYSLGVVLYVLLTGSRPYGKDEHSMPELIRVVCETEPVRPSTAVGNDFDGLQAASSGTTKRSGELQRLRRTLRGDLDSIVLKALRKEPRERYTTPAELSEDIRRYLEGRPVAARRGTASYRMRKFLKRHALALGIATCVAAFLVAATLVTLREAHVASQQAARAQRRFNDVRKLAHSLLFEDHDAIQNLPGSTAAKKLIIAQSLEYLDSLSHEAGNDQNLQRDLAEAYQRVGQIQGLAGAQNTGDPQAAIVSLSKSLAIRQELARTHPADIDTQLALAKTYRAISRIRAVYLGELPAAMRDIRQALAISERLNGSGKPDSRVLRELAAEHQGLSYQLGGNAGSAAAGDLDASLAEIATATAITEELVRMEPADRTAKRLLGVMHHNYGDELVELGRRQEAWQHYEDSDRLSAELLAAGPHDVEIERAEANTIDRMAEVLLMDGRKEESLSYFRRASQLIEPLFTADAQDKDMRIELADNLLGVGISLGSAGRTVEGLQVLHRALRLVTEDAAVARTQQGTTIAAFAHLFAGSALMGRKHWTAAAAEFQQACDLLESMVAESPNDNVHGLMLAGALNQLASARFAHGELDAAERGYRRALSLSAEVAARYPTYLEAAYSMAMSNAGLGDIAAAQASARRSPVASTQWQEACDLYSKSLRALDSFQEPAILSPGFFPVRDRRELAARLNGCQQASTRTRAPASAR